MATENVPIKLIEIFGLHGNKNIRLSFDSSTKILVDENGSGKTTFLNLVLGILEGSTHKVNRFEFETVRIVFSGEREVNFDKSDFGLGWVEESHPLVQRLFSMVSIETIERLVTRVFRRPIRGDEELARVADLIGVPSDLLHDVIRSTPEFRKLRNQIAHAVKEPTLFDFADDPLKEKFAKVKEYFPYRILYFPTYRLVEENLRNLGQHKRDFYRPFEQLIQFGMGDVRTRWDEITEEMQKTSVRGFAQINGRMLDELTEEIDVDAIDYSSIEDKSALNLTLSRSGDNIKDRSKKRIRDLVETGDIRSERFVPLSYFLSNLIAIHEQQKDKDDAIIEFVEVVNRYLRDKEILALWDLMGLTAYMGVKT